MLPYAITLRTDASARAAARPACAMESSRSAWTRRGARNEDAFLRCRDRVKATCAARFDEAIFILLNAKQLRYRTRAHTWLHANRKHDHIHRHFHRTAHGCVFTAHKQLIAFLQHFTDHALYIIDFIFFLRGPVDFIFPIAIHAHVNVENKNFRIGDLLAQFNRLFAGDAATNF